jgi:arabinose-5-phosphate isomerase
MQKVSDIMQVGSVNPVVDEKSCFREVLEVMNEKKMGVVNIVDGESRLIGIITDGDVKRLLLKTQDTLPELFIKNIVNIMIKNPKTIHPDASPEECLALLEKYEFWVVPVVDQDCKLLGMVHLHKLLKSMAR